MQIIKEIESERLLNPICIEGDGACPPEDVGGTHGFEEFKAIMRDKSHPERESYIEWCGSEYDPDLVELIEINKVLANLDEYMRQIDNA